MKIISSLLLAVSLVSSQMSSGAEIPKAMAAVRGVLQKGLSSSLEDQQASAKLLEKARLLPHLAITSGKVKGRVVVACARRVPTSSGTSEKKSLIRLPISTELLRFRAGKSPELQKAMEPFKYSELLYNHVGTRLLSKVRGRIFGLGENTDFFLSRDYVVGVVSLKPDQVEVKAVEVFSADEIKPVYLGLVIRRLRNIILEGKYKEGLEMLFEAKKYGYATREYIIELYYCYLFTGKPEEMARISRVILNKHGATLTDDDCLALSALATEAKQVKEADLWSLEAKKRSSVTLDSFLRAVESKELKDSPEDKPKGSPKKKNP